MEAWQCETLTDDMPVMVTIEPDHGYAGLTKDRRVLSRICVPGGTSLSTSPIMSTRTRNSDEHGADTEHFPNYAILCIKSASRAEAHHQESSAHEEGAAVKPERDGQGRLGAGNLADAHVGGG